MVKRLRELMAIVAFLAIAVLLGSYFITPVTGIVGIGYAWIGAHGIVSVYVAFALRSRYYTWRA